MQSKMKHLLVTLPLEESHRNKLKSHLEGTDITFCSPKDKEAVAKALESADVAIVGGGIGPELFAAPRMKWVHVDAAGLDSLAKKSLFEKDGPMITGSAGRSAPALAEHTLFFFLSFAYRVRAILAAQSDKRWGYAGQEETAALYQQTIGILGLGNTGIALAKRAKALEMTVLAHKRGNIEKPDYVDVLYTEENGDGIDELLQRSDFIAVAAPLNNKTYHMIGERELGMMKRSAVIANVGRGACIDEQALIRALRDGRLAGAGLDTFEQEPLPADSPLWGMENVIVTPHFTPPCPDKLGRSLDIVLANIDRYQDGKPLLNLLTKADIFDL